MARTIAESIHDDERDVEITQEEKKEMVVMNEEAILRALSNGDQFEGMKEIVEVKIGEAVFQFRIRPLTEKEWDKCRERNTKYAKNRRLAGIRIPESTDTAGYHSDLIYTATVDEDRAKLWDNKVFWRAVNAVTGKDMVDKLIPRAGTKQSIIERIERLSGYDEEDESDEDVKN